MFKRDGHAMALAQSFAKNMGLYGHRVGTLSIVCASKEEATVVESQLKVIARAMYSSPPLQGANLVSTILGDEKLNALWLTEVKMMADRIIDMRAKLREALEKSGSTMGWKHVTDQIGMFCYSGLTPEQVDRLKDEHHIYMTRNGRISMAGVTSKTVEKLAQAMHAVTAS
jgi:aspartate aminotransferase